MRSKYRRGIKGLRKAVKAAGSYYDLAIRCGRKSAGSVTYAMRTGVTLELAIDIHEEFPKISLKELGVSKDDRNKLRNKIAYA